MHILFTSPKCPECTRLKQILSKENTEYLEYDVTSAEGLSEYHYYSFRQSVPMLVLKENDNIPIDVTDKYLNNEYA